MRARGAPAVAVHVERHDVAYANGRAWRAEQCTHGERLALEHTDQRVRAACQRSALVAIESCREAAGPLHWRPQVAYAIATE